MDNTTQNLDHSKINLSTLPDECLLNISYFLPYTQFIHTFSLINKRLNQFVIDVTGRDGQFVPNEVIFMICTFLSAKDLCVFSLVCKDFHKIASSPLLWKILFKKKFPKKEISGALIRMSWKQRYIKLLNEKEEGEQNIAYYPREYNFVMTDSNVIEHTALSLNVNIGSAVIIGGVPCRIHSFSRYRRAGRWTLYGKEFFTNKDHIMTIRGMNKVYQPILRITTYEVIYITEDDLSERFLVLMDSNGETKEDVRLPLGLLGKKIVKGFQEGKQVLVDVLNVMEEEEVIDATIKEETSE